MSGGRFGTEDWSLFVPAGWRAWHDPECATLVPRADEGGALQLSAYFKGSDVEDGELREFIEGFVDDSLVPRPIVAGDFVGLEVSFEDEELAWRYWYLRRKGTMLLVTYNCPLGSRGLEDDAIQCILSSLRAVERPEPP